MIAPAPHTARAFTARERRHIRWATSEARDVLRPLYQMGVEQAAAARTPDEAEAFVMAGLTTSVQREPLRSLLETIHLRVQPDYAQATYERHARERATMQDWMRAVRTWLGEHAGELVTEMAATSRTEIIAALRRIAPPLVAEGKGMGPIAAELRRQVDGMTRTRAVRIARTEVMTAQNHGSWTGARAAAQEFDVALRKKWLATSGGRTRRTHTAANGQTVDMDEDFTVGGFPARYPCDPNLPARERVNCRCTTTFAVED